MLSRGWVRQFASPVIWLLLVATVLSAALREWLDAIAIGAIVILNAVIGFFPTDHSGGPGDGRGREAEATATTCTKNGKPWTRTTGGDVTANWLQAHLASMWSWAIHPKRAYADSSPFSHAGRVPEELKKPKEHHRDRRLHPGEEESLLQFAPQHLGRERS